MFIPEGKTTNEKINSFGYFYCSVCFSITFAQSNSVYTRAGIGDLEYGYSAKMVGIGNIGTTQLDPDHLLTTNPASSYIYYPEQELNLDLDTEVLSSRMTSSQTIQVKQNLRELLLEFRLAGNMVLGP